jgi:tol-pal system protein YbgF
MFRYDAAIAASVGDNVMISRHKVARRGIHLLWAGMATAAILSTGMSAFAQNSSSQEMLNRINRLQNEITTLQRHVYQGKTPPAVAPGPSSAAPGSAAPGANLSARQSLRLTQLENEIRRLTGANEELTHRLGQVQTRLDKMSTDTEFRLKTLEGGSGSVASADPSAKRGAPDSLSKTLPTVVPAGSATAPIANADKGARVLGALRVPGNVAPNPVALAETPEQQYDRAHSLIIKKRDYAQAEKVFSEFIAKHPKHELAPNAYYWLGRTFFVRNDFKRSVATFAEGFQKHSESKKAPATLLNLGMSLARLGKNREACTTFAHLQRNFPKAEGAVKRRLVAERKTSKCRP